MAELRANRPRLEALGVERLYLFGSFARDQAGAESDVDIMIDLDEGPHGRKPLFSSLDLGGIQYELTEIVGRRVDLAVRSDALAPGRKLRPVAEKKLVEVF
ncbi:MAG: nucleotidyltransferase domain-containing protein [Caulobacteraceae bacterium]